MEPIAPAVSERLHVAIADHRAGRIADAIAGYEAVLAHAPAQFDALHLLGVIALHAGDAPRAIDLLSRAVAAQPDAWPAWCQLGRAHAAAGSDGAAESSFLRAIELAPDDADARDAYGFLLFGQGRLAEAVEQFAVVARVRPGSAAAHGNLGTALGQLERYQEALASYERALAIDPKHHDALLNAAQVLATIGRPQQALEYARSLAALDPLSAWSCYRVGRLLYVQGMHADAREAFGRALAQDPDFVEARWERVMAGLPLAYGPDEDPAQYRARFATELADLDQWFGDARVAQGHRAVGTRQPFYLAFHDVDNRPLLSRYGDLCARLMRVAPGLPPPSVRRPSAARPVQVAVVSEYFYDQSVWTALVRGWCTNLDRGAVAMHLFHTGKHRDAQTAIAEQHAASFHMGCGDVAEWAAGIEKLQPDVILYPEIGMDGVSLKLASLRLAPAQVVAWGHPQTSGLPTLDYFLSAEAFEPQDGAAHYRERLVVLPNLGCCYEPLLPPDVDPDWHALGVDEGVPRLICPGTAYKYFPEHDHMLVEIARRLGRCQLLFFVDMAPRLSRMLEDRLHLAFRAKGLDARQYVRFLPWQSRPAFFGLMRHADIYLDTIGFSGFNTAMQAMECGLPIVTCEGRFMRGRLAAGVLRRMGMDELVARDTQGYVDLAVHLGDDVAFRAEVRGRIAARRSVLFGDLAPVRALEGFLASLAGR